MVISVKNKPIKSEPDLIPARMLNEYVYCPRLCYLEWIQGQFEHNADTLEGKYRHRRVDKEEAIPNKSEDEQPIHARSVLLSSENYRLIARIDLVELECCTAVPIEYKRGNIPDIPGQVWDSDLVQLMAQAIILREHGYKCTEGIIYYVGSKTKVPVSVNDERINKVLEVRDRLLSMAETREIPAPLEDSPKCFRCSLAGICLPDEVNYLKAMDKKKEPRRLVPGRQDALPLYVQFQGAFVGKKGEELVVKKSGNVLDSIRLLDVSQVSLFGNVQVSTQAIRELLSRDIPVCYFSYGGWFLGLTTGLGTKNIELRIRQFQGAQNDDISLSIARQLISGKIRNYRTLLRRNHPEVSKKNLKELDRFVNKSGNADNKSSLLGIEGIASKVYFSNFVFMLKPRKGHTEVFNYSNRNRRPPKDPVNAMLSFMYALLAKDMTTILFTVGFDPYLGFFHEPRYGRPSLALDMMEEFRPLICDSVVLTVVNRGEVDSSCFIQQAGAVALTKKGRKKMVEAYERRMDTLITHPIFGYKISYRRILEVQARLLGRSLCGEIEQYPPFITR